MILTMAISGAMSAIRIALKRAHAQSITKCQMWRKWSFKMIQIKHRFTNAVLCEFDAVDIKDCLEKAVKSGANLWRANLEGANLWRANLEGANLMGASLMGANLEGANLEGANLMGASLMGANIMDASLMGANLRGANLMDASLEGASLRGEKIAISPVLIGGLTWHICISESYLQIGCQRHKHKEWAWFDDETIENMNSRASEFWKQNKSWLLSACKAHRKESLAYRKANPEKGAKDD
jgi:uncharacterized protein YjbI with pentapeptide repeats